MALAKVWSRAQSGIDSPLVAVEADLLPGLPSITLVGLPETEVRESRERVRSALVNSGFSFPVGRITLSLAPADLPKAGGRFDLPIALGILAASGQIPKTQLDRYEFAGELALSGALREFPGAVAMMLGALADGRELILPQALAEQAALLPQAPIWLAESLLDVCAFLHQRQPLSKPPLRPATEVARLADLSEIRGQSAARRVLEIAAAGGHSLLLSGPPGTGKSMLAQRLPGILPLLSEAEAQEVALLQSLAGQPLQPEAWAQVPFRAPHHSASMVALVGGGSEPRPGEISLAHRGVLFLDELPEFDRRVLEALREPLEQGQIAIARASRRCCFPSRFQLIAAMNPCPCGYQGHPSGKCHCSPEQIQRYRSKISGPLLDRIDLMFEMPVIPASQLTQMLASEASAVVAERVKVARDCQLERQHCLNSQLSVPELQRHAELVAAPLALLNTAIDRLGLSARAGHRVWRVARTLADLAGAERIETGHLAEAMSYRH